MGFKLSWNNGNHVGSEIISDRDAIMPLSAKKPVPPSVSCILRVSPSTRFHSWFLDLLPLLLMNKNDILYL